MRKSQSNFNVKLRPSFQLYATGLNIIEAGRIAMRPALLFGIIGFFKPMIKSPNMVAVGNIPLIVYANTGLICFLIVFLIMYVLNFVYLSFFKSPIIFSPVNVNTTNQLLIQPVGHKLVIFHLKKPLDKEQVMKWQQYTGRYLHETILESRDDIHMLNSIAVLSETDRQRLKQVRLF